MKSSLPATLARALLRAARRSKDPLVRRWARALARRGEEAVSKQELAKAPRSVSA
jgi:hypothetical protein